VIPGDGARSTDARSARFPLVAGFWQRRLGVVLLLAVLIGSGASGHAQEPTSARSLGDPASTIEQLARYGIRFGAPERTADGLTWSGGATGVVASLAGTDRTIHRAEISLDLIRALGGDQAAIRFAVEGWVWVLAPDAIRTLNDIAGDAPRDGMRVDRHIGLGRDRMFRIVIDPEAFRIDLALTQVEPAYRVSGLRFSSTMCRELDLRTTQAQQWLDLSYAVIVEPTSEQGRHVWLVIGSRRTRPGPCS
jgi:hypothetical protein